VREERGQTAAEYMGALLIVSAIIGALATSNAGATIASQAEQLVCRIGGGDCAPAQPPAGGRDIQAVQGPPLSGGPIVALPFPGSVAVTCTADSRQPGTCMPQGKPGVSVQASGEIKIERTPTTLDANGCPWQNLAVSTTFRLTGNAEAQRAKAGGALQAYLGRSTNYQLTVSPSAADEIAGERRTPPNPVDPRSLRTGESIQLTKEFFAGLGAKGTYRGLQLELGYDAGTRVSSAIQRLNARTVRVLVGDEEFVRAALKVGFDFEGIGAALGNTKDLSHGNLHAVDIDVSTRAGWDAYQAFLKSGRLPTGRGRGTSNRTTAETVVYTDTTQMEGKVGPITIGGRGASSEGRLTTTRRADGSEETVAVARYNDTSLAITTGKDRYGRPVTPTYSLLLRNLHPSYIPGLYQRTGQRPPENPSRNVRLDFTETQLKQLQQIALSKLADEVERNGRGRPSNAEIARSLRENHGVVKYKGVEYAFGGLESDLGAATNPNDMLIALYRPGAITPNNVVEQLAGLLSGKQRNLPATIVNPSC
jgi:hypothetical protein